jgi:hypothetical protein
VSDSVRKPVKKWSPFPHIGDDERFVSATEIERSDIQDPWIPGDTKLHDFENVPLDILSVLRGWAMHADFRLI